MTTPLVSCIMPTRDRRPFVGRAIEYFLRQDYAERELIVLDDGKDPVQDLVPDDPRVRYVHQDRRATVGAKRNRACALARGDVLVHWDDDDWMAPWRLTYQVKSLLESEADVCGLARLYFYDPAAEQAWQYVYPDSRKKWVAGGTFCYRRSFWQQKPFPEIDVGEDNRFLWRSPSPRILELDDPRFYVALVHAENTSRKRTGSSRWHSCPAHEIHDLLGQDHAFYRRDDGDDEKPSRPAPRPAPTGDSACSDPSLVSCIMATADRRAFVPSAIRYFLRQDYPERELIVLDDGRSPIKDLVPDDPRIRYHRLGRKLTLGAKRNRGCQLARGEIIAFWDDDDWYGPHRLSHQIAPLLAGRADLTVLAETPFYLHPVRQFWACSPRLHARMFHRGMVGGTHVFFKRLWRPGARYPDTSLAEDIAFIKVQTRRGARIEKLTNEGTFVYVRHHDNTWRFATGSYLDHQGWRQIEPPAWVPREDLPGEDLPGEDPPAEDTAVRERPSRRATAIAASAGARAERPRLSSAATKPLVSCIMATGDRHAFLRRAVTYFQRQSYDNKELILIDDGTVSSAELVPADERIRYLRLEERTNLGRKLNLGVEHAAGSIVQKLDDDDYYHPDFLATMTGHFGEHGETDAVLGLDSFLVLIAETGQLRFSGPGWCAGGTLCFSRELWNRTPFRDEPKAVDWWFLKDHARRRARVDGDPELYILVRHDAGHLWTNMGQEPVTEYFKRLSPWARSLTDCLPRQDPDFYDKLRRNLIAGRAPAFIRELAH